MSSLYQKELESKAHFLSKILSENKILNYILYDSLKDYHICIHIENDKDLFLYYKPTKKTYSISTHMLSSQIKDKIEEIWYKLEYEKTLHTEYYAYVDGSFIKDQIGYAFVLYQKDTILHQGYGNISTVNEENTRQVAGEIKAVTELIKYLEAKNEIKELTIFYDYEGLHAWATHKWKANKKLTKDYQAFMTHLNLKIYWEKVKAHTKNPKNELVDSLAKKGALSNV